jgi:hypothetical protein
MKEFKLLHYNNIKEKNVVKRRIPLFAMIILLRG